MKVKICGIKTLEDALAAEQAGADFIGFVFAPSKRRIAPIKAAEITSKLSHETKKVGVFVNESVENMIHIARMAGLDYIQLHGNESAEVSRKLPCPVIKAFSINKVTPNTLRNYPCEYLLIDSPGTQFEGGSGIVFDWSELDTLQIDRNKFILAGGLTEENVGAAITQTNPIGIDVSSGVETNGVKDHLKIGSFIKQAKLNRKVEIK